MLGKVFNKMYNYMRGVSNNENEPVVPSHESMQATALKFYLKPYMTGLCEMKTTSLNYSIYGAKMKIINVFQDLYKPRIFDDEKRSHQVWLCKDLSKVSLTCSALIRLNIPFCTTCW